MYEHKSAVLLSRTQFARRVALHLLVVLGAIVGALLIGMAGYHCVAGLSWIDSLLNASMILGGMGPVDHIDSAAGKVFASFYALFSGLFFIGILGVLLAPFVHRLMHSMHIDKEVDGDEG